MLHIATQTVRTIAFRKENGDYVWISEQETFEGPKTYKTVDGTFHEAITLSYEIGIGLSPESAQCELSRRGPSTRCQRESKSCRRETHSEGVGILSPFAAWR